MKKNGKKAYNPNVPVLLLLSICIMAVLLGIEYLTTTTGRRNQAYQTSAMLVDQVRSVLLSNEKKERSLTDSLKEDYIAKAKAVSYIVDNVPETETDIAELIRIATLMSIDEIHLFTEDGMIYGGTVPPYYGFTFDSGEQIAFFKPMLANKALSMCQDVTPNTAEGKAMMYAICWNDAGTRMTQIGIEPRRLLDEMRTNEISEVVTDMPVYSGVDIIVADRQSGEILGATMSRQIGSTLSEIGIDLEGRDLSGICDFSAVVARKVSYCSAGELDDYVIVVTQERSHVNRDVPTTMLIVFIYLLLAAIVIALVVRHTTRRILAEQINANTDPMTGFLNRRAYETDMKRLDKDGGGEDLVYISIDLNGLKEINDNFGHEAGDALLIGAAECMFRAFGEYGKLYRIGGDEFVVLLNADTARLAELRKSYEGCLRVWSERHGRTLSTACGYVRAAEAPDKSMVELAKLADQRMYEAKAEYYHVNGKDRRKG
jgi:diguanylate cyclase (GGDEF)-like protein